MSSLHCFALLITLVISSHHVDRHHHHEFKETALLIMMTTRSVDHDSVEVIVMLSLLVTHRSLTHPNDMLHDSKDII